MKLTSLRINPKRHHLHYTAPVNRWDEGLPLGNGLLGLLVWGDGRPLNLSVDRGDLWDNRPDPKTTRRQFNWKHLTELVDRGDIREVVRVFEDGQDATPYPTKLPCGRLQLEFGRAVAAVAGHGHNNFTSHLDFATAISTTRLGKTIVTAYVHAKQPLIVVRARGGRPRVRFLSAFEPTRKETAGIAPDQSGADVLKLGYPPLQKGRRDGVEYLLQRCAEGFSFTVAWTTLTTGQEWRLYLTVQPETGNRDPLRAAIRMLTAARVAGPAKLEKSHVAWWKNYWHRGHIRLPEARLEHLWYTEMYKLGAAARVDTPPLSLQAVWTADKQNLPPWRGDCHHDLNTQMAYWPVHTAGRVEQSLGFAKWLHALLPKYRQFARDFYGAPGANVPGAQGLTGEIIPGWAAYMYSRTTACWLLQHLWWHWRFTLDREFLRDIAYPFMREVARFAVSQLTRETDGQYHVHHSSSPEFNSNWRESFTTDSTHDLACIRYALAVTAAAARVLRVDAKPAREWDRIRSQLPPYPLSPERPKWPAPEGGLAIWQGQRLTESHRHLAQCMPIFPLGDVNIEGGDHDREIIRHTISEIESMGTGFWCGFSFAWYACLGARVREPHRALWSLRQYRDWFTSPNTFHLNGDFKGGGASRFHYRPFTLEGGLGAGQAINEMLLQSWGDKLRLFPAVPAEWRDVVFTELRGEGAFVVSAWRQNGAFVRAEIVSEKGTPVRLEHPHPTRPVAVCIGRQQRRFAPGRDLSFQTRRGERYVVEITD